jgi:hypothetical protein
MSSRWAFGAVVGLGARRFGRWRRRGQQLAGAIDVARSSGAGEQAVMADAVEAGRQHVHEKASDELGGVERHGPEPIAPSDPIVLPSEGDARPPHRERQAASWRSRRGGCNARDRRGRPQAQRRVAWRRGPTRTGATAPTRRRRRLCRRASRDRRRRPICQPPSASGVASNGSRSMQCRACIHRHGSHGIQLGRCRRTTM